MSKQEEATKQAVQHVLEFNAISDVLRALAEIMQEEGGDSCLLVKAGKLVELAADLSYGGETW